LATRETKWLREAIGVLLVPELEKRGFRAVPLKPDERRSEVAIAFPFGRMRRPGPGGLEIVEIQLDKRGAPAFRLNLGIAPPEGVHHPLGFVPQEDVWVHYLDQSYELYDRSLLGRRKWFSLPWWRGKAIERQEVERLVQRVVALIPEVEALFREGKRGPHIREVRRR